MERSMSHSNDIPNAKEFETIRNNWRQDMADSKELRLKALELIILSDKFHYGYLWEWCGIPIIRHPDDIVLQQEIMWKLKPKSVIETGIARGGSLALSASLMKMYSPDAKVLGLDNLILEHTCDALRSWIQDGQIEIYECDSNSNVAVEVATKFLNFTQEPSLLVLDSNHTHDHVLGELNGIASLLPVGSVVMVADTLISEMPQNYYSDRPWDKDNNPRSAVCAFLASNKDYELDKRWARRSLLGEFRDGILVKKS